MQPFTNQIITINSGDTIYLCTDGFSDQFGGPTGNKKLTKKRFKELLISIQHLSLEMQKEKLDTFFKNYRDKGDQIDDVLVFGIKF